MDKDTEEDKTLLPALMQCFGIILIGYVFGRTKIIGQAEAKGLTAFVQYLALPTLIFTTVSTIPFTQVKWEFIAAVFISKVLIFIGVTLASMMLSHPFHLGAAGIYAMSATQSNDFALGYPLITSLYQNTHPEYASYLYIIAPIQLLILNSAGFFFLETEKHSCRENRKMHMLHVLSGTLKNPVVITTIIGLVWNLTYGQKVLPIFEDILKAFSSAFPATALLLVGYTMSINSEQTNSRVSLPTILLILTKSLFLPLILQKFTKLLLKNKDEKMIESFSNFGFLYGTIPTAPTVYVFATQYDVCVDIVTKIIIGSTLFSAPLMFTSASLISLDQLGIKNFTHYLNQTISYISAVNLFCCVWLLFIFCTGRRWKSLSFGVTILLIASQLLLSIGGVIHFFTPVNKSVLFYAQFLLSSGSIFSTRFCTFFLALLLLIIRVRSLCFVLKIRKFLNLVSIVVCFLIPYAIAASLIASDTTDKLGFIFPLGFAQVVLTFVVTLVCLGGTIICIISQHIILRKHRSNIQEEPSLSPQNSLNNEGTASHTVPKKLSACCDIEDLGTFQCTDDCDDNQTTLISQSIQESVCDIRYNCSPLQRIGCSTEISRYVNENNEIGTGLIDDEYFFRHILLIIMLGVAMTLSLSVCLWKLIMEKMNGVFIELEFLDIITNYGLGVLCFILFGLDSRLLRSLYSFYKKATQTTDIATETTTVCDQFFRQYYDECKEDIGTLKVIHNVEYHDAFSSTEFLHWILNKNIVQTIFDAHTHTDHLLKGRILEKLNDSEDGETVYKLC